MVRRILRAERLFRRGQRFATEGHFDEALEAFTQAQELRPRAAGIYLHRALALAETPRWPEAVLALQQAMALQPANPVLPMFLGRIYVDHTDYTNAALWCARALVLSPANCLSLFQRWSVASYGAVGAVSPPLCSRPMRPCRVECCCTLKHFCCSMRRRRGRWPSNYSIPRRRPTTRRLPTNCWPGS